MMDVMTKANMAWEEAMERIHRKIDYHTEKLKLNPNSVLTIDILKKHMKEADIGNQFGFASINGMKIRETPSRDNKIYATGNMLFIPKFYIVPKTRMHELGMIAAITAS